MSEFYDALAAALDRQYLRYQPYRALCEMEGVSLEDLKVMVEAGELHAIPAIPADWFKRKKGKGLYRELADLEHEGQWLVSSGTGGDASYTWRTPADLQTIRESFARAYRHLPVAGALAFSPDPGFLAKVGRRFAIDDRPVVFYATVPAATAGEVFPGMEYLARLQPLRTLWSMARSGGRGRPVLELRTRHLRRRIAAAERDGSPLIFAASVLMLYPTLLELAGTFELGENAYFLTGAGGWDGKKGTMEGEAIRKSRFVADMCGKFAIPAAAAASHFWDVYGTTENGKAQAGSYSPEYEDYVFTVGGDVKLYVVNPVTGRPAAVGEQGFPKFISPYGAQRFAGVSIQQNDVFTVVSSFDDGSTRQFTHISRASAEEGTEAAGCAYLLAEGTAR